VTPWTAARVRAALGLAGGTERHTPFSRVLTDTRALVPGALFVALSGDRFDGHDYLDAAAAAR
jgi:UDP-N-acetylmuramoyl-tripeptide--D-alanyl-D-alanine ligase